MELCNFLFYFKILVNLARFNNVRLERERNYSYQFLVFHRAVDECFEIRLYLIGLLRKAYLI